MSSSTPLLPSCRFGLPSDSVRLTLNAVHVYAVPWSEFPSSSPTLTTHSRGDTPGSSKCQARPLCAARRCRKRRGGSGSEDALHTATTTLPLSTRRPSTPVTRMWVVRGGEDGDLRPWHCVYVYSIESRLIMSACAGHAGEGRRREGTGACRCWPFQGVQGSQRREHYQPFYLT